MPGSRFPTFMSQNPSESHFVRLRTELEKLGMAGNMTTDAHLAVLAMERRYVLYSTDTYFAHFSVCVG